MLVIADYFVEDIAGGGELSTEEIIKFLREEGMTVDKIHSHEVSPAHLKSNGNEMILISNFINLSREIKMKLITDKRKYCLIEHDHKYCKSRNPLTYKNMIVPEEEMINVSFFKNAKAVLCQSKTHAEIVQKNLWSDNIINLGCNLWSDDSLFYIENLRYRSDIQPNIRKYGIMNSSNKIKGTKEAIELCKSKGLEYELIGPSEQHKFYDELYKTETIVFLPQSFETYSRFVIEAKMLGCKMITNKAIGVMSEDYYKLDGADLISEIRWRRDLVLSKIKNFVKTGLIDKENLLSLNFIPPLHKPKVSLITTVYKGSEYIAGYIDAFLAQTYSGPTELIIIDAASPENEAEITKPYLDKHANISYNRLTEKVTTATALNKATEMASGDLICMCMIDDRLSPEHFNILAKHLTLDSSVDLVYGDTIVGNVPNEKFAEDLTRPVFDHSKYPFSNENMIKNICGPMPMFRKSLHSKVGGFDENILHGMDWEFILKSVQSGSKFKRINKQVGIYFNNPNGLSTTSDSETTKARRKSEKEIFYKYKNIFGDKVFEHFKPYFDSF